MARTRRQPTSAESGSQPLHMTFRLSEGLRKQLEDAAVAAGDRTIGEEIRLRLDASFSEREADDETRRLLNAVAKIASDVTDLYGTSWLADRFVAEKFRGSVRVLFDWAVPLGDIVERQPKVGSMADRLVQNSQGMTVEEALGFAAAAKEGFI